MDYKTIYGVIHSFFRYLFLNNFVYICSVEKNLFFNNRSIKAQGKRMNIFLLLNPPKVDLECHNGLLCGRKIFNNESPDIIYLGKIKIFRGLY